MCWGWGRAGVGGIGGGGDISGYVLVRLVCVKVEAGVDVRVLR